MSLMEKLKELIGEYDEESAAANATGDDETSEQKDVDESPVDNKSTPEETVAKISGAEVATPDKGSEEGNAEKSKQEESMQDDKDNKLQELQAKIEKLEAEVAKTKGGKTGFEPSGAATSTDADVKRWRVIAGLEDE